MKRKILLILIILMVLSGYHFGQIKVHKAYTTEDGLIYGEISDILKDSFGYLWIATLNGLSKWDGKTFQNYTTENGLAGSQVLDIEEGPDSTLYFSTFGYGVTILKNNIFDTLNTNDGLITNFVSKVYFSRQGKMFLGAGGELFVYENGNFENISRKLKIPIMGIWDIIENSKGDLFLATYNGLVKISENQARLYTVEDGLNINHITALAITDNDVIYASTDAGANIIDNARITSVLYEEKRINSSMEDVFNGNDNAVFLGSEKGLYVFNEGMVNLINKSNGLNNNSIGSIYQDENGTVFIGTKHFGINIYKPGLIENYSREQGLEKTNVTTIADNNDGVLLIGTKAGVVFYDTKNKESRIIDKSLSNETVNVLSLSSNGEVYVGTMNGLNILKENLITKTRLITGKSFDRIYALEELNDSRILIGKMEGLFVYKEKLLKILTTNDGLPSNYVKAILQRKNGSIAVGTHGKGVVVFNNSDFTDHEVLIDDGIINCLFESSDSTLWIGTDRNGAIKIKNKFVQKINTQTGISSNNILGITEDKFGKIYFSTPKGLNIISDSNEGVFIRTVNKQDGLISNECSLNALFCDRSGIIWVGTKEGLTKFDPSEDVEIKKPPKVYLTGLEIFNKPVNFQNFISAPTLRHEENYLKFYFTGIDLSAPLKVKYSYRLSGVDKDWVSGSSSSVQYTSLDNGVYSFKVKAMNEWGNWSKASILKFEILPAWWETWWFRTAASIVITIFIWMMFRMRLNYLVKLERLRTRIASDLHDEVGSLLTQISMNADMISYSNEFNQIKNKSSFIRSKCNEVIGIMSDIVWSIDARKDNFESLIDRTNHFASTFLKQKGIDLDFKNNIREVNKTLKIDFRQNILMIVKEAINNAVKHSGCSKILIEMKYSNRVFELIISDNGKGMDEDVITHGNGIKNIKMRARSINAELKFFNKNGLTIRLTKKNL